MSKRAYRYLDPSSMVVIALTLVLFLVALAVKGLTHELLLESGVFLVSAKLVLMTYKNAVANESLEERLDGIQEILRRIEDSERSG
jgi:predicted neutral ceramidase superfamily lipid hydrolase